MLPFQNLSPHPEIQEERAVALWKIATGAASIRGFADCRDRPSSAFRRVLRRSGAIRAPRRNARYSNRCCRISTRSAIHSTDVVEMPGEYALRGGILDVYSPEADRPVRIEFFGDEVESIRKFDPATQRSSNPVDEALLLPLTETPVSEELLGAVHARLSGKRITGTEEIYRAGGALRRRDRVSGMGVLRARGRRRPYRVRSAAACPGADRRTGELSRPSSITSGRASKRPTKAAASAIWCGPRICIFRRKTGGRKLASLPGADVEHLEIERSDEAEAVSFHSQPTPRFHGSVPAMLEEVKKQIADRNEC